MSEKCARCGHPADWHRHDDEGCLSKHPQPCAPAGCGPGPIHPAPFRCLGYDVDGAGWPAGTPETRCGCPDFVKAVETPAPPPKDAAESPAPQGWQPISTAPKDGTEILLRSASYRRVGNWARLRECWSIDALPPVAAPTHWAPIPQDYTLFAPPSPPGGTDRSPRVSGEGEQP